jgi:hypothetical protein
MREMVVGKGLDQDIARVVGRYYFEKQNGSRTLEYRKNAAMREIAAMKIHSIHFDGSDIVIALESAGQLIGVGGSDVRALEKALREEFEFKLLKVVDDYLERYLFSFKNDL